MYVAMLYKIGSYEQKNTARSRHILAYTGIYSYYTNSHMQRLNKGIRGWKCRAEAKKITHTGTTHRHTMQVQTMHMILSYTHSSTSPISPPITYATLQLILSPMSAAKHAPRTPKAATTVVPRPRLSLGIVSATTGGGEEGAVTKDTTRIELNYC